MNNFFANPYAHIIVPDERIAQKPASPRDSSRLLVVDTKRGTLATATFDRLSKHLPHPALMVLNDTKVAPSRVVLKKSSGKEIEVLFLINELVIGDTSVRALVDRRVTIGEELYFPNGRKFIAVGQEENIFLLEPQFPVRELIEELHRFGTTPTPPYITRGSLSESAARERYQTIFAKHEASVAAPTASLHFTPAVFASCEDVGIERTELTLDVGMGTFAPVRESHHRLGTLHREPYAISPGNLARIRTAQAKGMPIVAVGTTVVRTLESFALSGKASGMTDLFIRPPYDFKIVDALITNFHVPSSSLMYIVDAFLRFKKCPLSIGEIYAYALKNDFRFYSFGDAMVIV